VRPERYRLEVRPRAQRQLAGPPRGLALGVASAAAEFVLGPLLERPHQVGKPLRGKYEGQRSARCGSDHRIRYTIDDTTAVVTVLDISHRADTYGTD
jgi:mRNA interferase RelE/StbE